MTRYVILGNPAAGLTAIDAIRQRGWDDDGNPSAAKLAELGIG
jgi:hypothetical protein